MLATLAVLTLLFVVATTGASYYGFNNDDYNGDNRFLAGDRWTPSSYNQVVQDYVGNENRFLVGDDDVVNGGILKSGGEELNRGKPRFRNQQSKNFMYDGTDKDNKFWKKVKEPKNKNKKPKNKKPKNVKQKFGSDLHKVTTSPQNDDPTGNTRGPFNERTQFLQVMDNNPQQLPIPYHGRPRYAAPQQNQQDFIHYNPLGFYHQHPYSQFQGRPNYPPMHAPYPRDLPPFQPYTQHNHLSYGQVHPSNEFTAEGEKLSMALVKAIMDYLKATGDAQGLTKVVQALTAFNDIFTSPTYYGPLMDGYKKFLEKISATSFLQSLDKDQHLNMPRYAGQGMAIIEPQKFGQHLNGDARFNIEKKNSDSSWKKSHVEDISKTIGEYLAGKLSVASAVGKGISKHSKNK